MSEAVTAAVPPRSSSWSLGALLVLFWAAIYLPGLGNEELKGEEPRRVLPGLEMIRSGDWLQPVVAGESYHRKPPLTNWVTAAGVLTLGRVDEFAVRLPVTLFVLAFALGLYASVLRVAGSGPGFVAGMIVLTNIGMMEKGRLAEIEGIYISLTGLAFAAWLAFAAPRWAADAPRQNPWLGWLLAGPLLGLAFLAKGPPHLLLFYAVLAGVWWRTGRWKDALHPAHGLGVGLALATGLPWFIWSARTNPPVTAEGGETTGRLAELTSRLDPASLDFPSWFLQIFQGLGNFLPWIVILLVLVRKSWREKLGLLAPPRLLAGILIGCVLAYFLIALTPAARARFTLPLLGPASAAVALVLEASERSHHFTIPWRISLRVLAVLVGLVAVVLPWLVDAQVRSVSAVASVLALGVAYLAWETVQRWADEPVQLMIPTGLLMVALTALYAASIQPLKSRDEKLRPPALAIKALLAPDEKAIVYRAGLQPWVFYAWGHVKEINSRKDLPDKLDGPLILPSERWENERPKLEKLFGPSGQPTRVPNPWNNKDLLFVRFRGS